VKFRIAVDTNTLFSGLFFGGKPGGVIELILHRNADLVLSEYIRDEFITVTRRKGYPDESFKKLIELDNVRVVPDSDYAESDSMKLAKTICRDVKDVPILAFAMHGFTHNWIDHLVSGDPDLLTNEIGKWTKKRIVNANDFLQTHGEQRN